jgi:hypothetical protein
MLKSYTHFKYASINYEFKTTYWKTKNEEWSREWAGILRRGLETNTTGETGCGHDQNHNRGGASGELAPGAVHVGAQN